MHAQWVSSVYLRGHSCLAGPSKCSSTLLLPNICCSQKVLDCRFDNPDAPGPRADAGQDAVEGPAPPRMPSSVLDLAVSPLAQMLHLHLPDGLEASDQTRDVLIVLMMFELLNRYSNFQSVAFPSTKKSARWSSRMLETLFIG